MWWEEKGVNAVDFDKRPTAVGKLTRSLRIPAKRGYRRIEEGWKQRGEAIQGKAILHWPRCSDTLHIALDHMVHAQGVQKRLAECLEHTDILHKSPNSIDSYWACP